MKKILHPKNSLDKLGVMPNSKVSIAGMKDKIFLEKLRERTADVSLRELQNDSDLIFFPQTARKNS